MSLLKQIFSVVVLASVFVLTGCESILTQDPREHFVDGKIPKGAMRFANQTWEMPAVEKVLARLAADANNPHLVKVGVMDNGVDFTHPDLVNQIDFGTDGNKIISAGYDIMGGDRFGSPQILRYEYYAFGAEAIEGGKIKGPPADPFKKIKAYDQAFLDQFIPKLQANPALKGTLWTRLNKENFSLVGAQRYLNTEFNATNYKRMKVDYPDHVYSLNWKPKAGATAEEIQSEMGFRYAATFETLSLSEKGLPKARYAEMGLGDTMYRPEMALVNFDGADVFYEMLKKEYTEFANASGYQKDFDKLVEFMTPRLFTVADSQKQKIENSLDKIAEVTFYERKGYMAHDPFIKFQNAIYGSALEQKFSTLKEWPKAQIIPTAEDLKSAMTSTLDTFESMSNFVVNNPARFTAQEIEGSKTYLKKISTWKTFFEDYLNSRGWDPQTFGDLKAMDPKLQAAYKKHLVRTKHPLLDPAAIDQSHGSHVSGIIAKQNENIRIVPLRVVTESTKSSPIKDPEMLKDFKKGFAEWLREPLVVRALEGRFSPLMGGKKGAELVAALELVFQNQIPKNFEANKLDFRFLGEVEEAIKIAGKEKLKIVNVSLGTTFNKGVIDYRNLSSVKTVEEYFEFLKFEYFKWKIGKTASEKSPKTLFMIANGNDGAWLDGRSRSALPVDLSSSFLADFEDEGKKLIAPNNHLKNFLGVGSLSQIDELSSFSNILISKVPQVFAHGEAVLSPVRPYADSAMHTLYNSKIAPSFDLFAFLALDSTPDESDRLYKYWVDQYGLKGTPEEIKKQISKITWGLRGRADALESSGSGIVMDLFLKYPTLRREMSGTSMATPTMTGLLADAIEKEMVERKITTAALYDHPDFSPQKLIERVMKKAEPVYKDATVIDLKKWTGEKLWLKTAAEQELDQKIKLAEKGEAKILNGKFARKSLSGLQCRQLVGKKR